jgi:DNA-binding NarL/FixJ family response regulator
MLAVEAAQYLGQIHILLADDHTIIRSGLGLLLDLLPDFTLVAEVGDGGEGVGLVSKQHPDVAVLDIDGRKKRDYGHTAEPDYQSTTRDPSGTILSGRSGSAPSSKTKALPRP